MLSKPFVAFLMAMMILGLDSSLPLAQVTVNVGNLGIIADLPLFIAVEKGHFKEAGIDVKLHNFAGGAEMMAPLSVGQLEVGSNTGFNITMFNAIVRGLAIKVVASTAAVRLGVYDGQGILLRPDLREKLTTVAHLKGRKVAVNTAGSALVYSLGKILESAGLTLKDIDLVYIPWPDMGTALKNKAIDAGFAVEPFVSAISERGFGLKWVRQADIINNPYQDIAGVSLNSEWAAKNRDMATRFMTAWLKGAREYHEATLLKPNRKEAIGIAVKHTRIKDPGVYDKINWFYVNPNGFVDERSLADQIKWYHDNGYITAKPSVEAFVDNSYLKRAVERLGRYPEPPVR